MKALLLVDIQNDFLPTGALPVPEGDAVVPVANALLPHFPLAIATQDWHPANHGSFAASHPGRHPGELIELGGLPQLLWPVHCVQGTPGAEFAPGLQTARFTHVVHKGIDTEIDSYGGFFDNGQRRDTGLADLLRAHDVNEVYLLGLATDYCVKYTALDAIRLGFTTFLVADGCRGVNLQPDDVAGALAEMQAAGAILVRSGDILADMEAAAV